MRRSDSIGYLLTASAMVALLAGCGGSAAPPPSGASNAAMQSHVSNAAGVTFDEGLYATQWNGVGAYGYPTNNRRNKPPLCTIRQVRPDDVAVDRKGNVLVPDVVAGTVLILKGPTLCGPEAGSVADPYGGPTDVAAGDDATTGTFIVGNWNGVGGDSAGSVSVCTLKGGCTINLVGVVEYVGGVALAKNGDCWDSGQDVLYHADLVYHRGCAKSSRRAEHFLNRYFGGLDIDNQGHLVSISSGDAKLYVYSGCNPNCSLVGGPFQLRGKPFFGHLNRSATRLALGNSASNEVDVYSYSPRRVRFLYSFNNGLDKGDASGATYDPRSNE